MGYWDYHPIGGNTPLDVQLDMFNILGIEDDYCKFLERQSENNYLSLKKRL